MTTEDRFLSPQDIATRLGVTDRAVLDLIEGKKLQAIRVGRGRGVWRIREADYRVYLEARNAERTQEPNVL